MGLPLKASARESESGKEAAPTLDGGAPSVVHSDETHVRVQATRIGRFTLLHEIGSGGMGAVFAAYDEQLDRKVALKILRQTRSGAQFQRQRTLREARAAARIAHPNVIAVYEVGENDGNIHIAMEYVEGGTLLEWQTQERRSWRAILEMYLQAGDALLAAHDAEVVHRDFKPDEVATERKRTKHRSELTAKCLQPVEDGRGTMFGCEVPSACCHQNGRDLRITPPSAPAGPAPSPLQEPPGLNQ